MNMAIAAINYHMVVRNVRVFFGWIRSVFLIKTACPVAEVPTNSTVILAIPVNKSLISSRYWTIRYWRCVRI